MLTKVLSGRRIRYLLRRCFGLHLDASLAKLPDKRGPAAAILRHVSSCSRADWFDVGYGAEVVSFLCLCAAAKKYAPRA